MVGSNFEPTELGTPQGSPLSPLLSNILLDDLDKELEARGHRFARYMDDLVILVKSGRAGRRVMAKNSHYLTQKLKLKVNREKSQVVKIEELEYLGFTFRGIRIFVSSQALKDFKDRLRGLTSRSWGVSMAERLRRLNLYLRGWMNYFGISQHYSPIEELDGWLRRRILLRNADANGCVTGSSGVDREPASPICSSWAQLSSKRFRRALVVKATGACQKRWQRTRE